MRRVFWVTLGTGAGIVAVRLLNQRLSGATERAGGPGQRLAEFWAVVREAAAAREVELRDALGLDGRHDLVDAPGNGPSVVGGVVENR